MLRVVEVVSKTTVQQSPHMKAAVIPGDIQVSKHLPFFFFWNFICTFYKLFLDFSFFLFLYNIGCQKLTENFFNCQIHKQLSFFCCFFCCISSTFLHSITCISDNRKAHAYLHQKIYVFCYIYLNSYTDMCILMSKWIDRHPLKFSKVLSYKVFERKNCFKRCIRNWLLQVGS